jgi:hypothetical protein
MVSTVADGSNKAIGCLIRLAVCGVPNRFRCGIIRGVTLASTKTTTHAATRPMTHFGARDI